jgi:hypothetical protein
LARWWVVESNCYSDKVGPSFLTRRARGEHPLVCADVRPMGNVSRLRPGLGKPGSTWNRPQNLSRAESSPRVGELSLPAQNRIWLHRFCILAHSNPLENTGIFHRTTARRTPLPRELLALVSLPRDGPPPLSRCRLSRAAAGEPRHAGR